MIAARAPLALLAALLVTGCSGNADWPPVALDAADREAAEDSLHRPFMIIHDTAAQRPEALDVRLAGIASRLGGVMPDAPTVSLDISNEADADATCLAGGRIVLSRGLVARVRHADELAGIAALAATQCGQASREWRRRADLELPPLDAESWLMNRYRDFRVEAGIPLYRSLVRTGCGADNDCLGRAREWLTAMGADPDGPARLLERIRESWPDAAVLERFAAPGAAPAPEEADSNPALDAELAGFRELRTGFDHMRSAWRELIAGNIRQAYRDNSNARREADFHWVTRLMQIRLDLVNMHPFYSERDLRELKAERPDYPYYVYWEAWIDLTSKRWSSGIGKANESLDRLPRVDMHFLLGRVLELRRHPETAAEHYRAAAAGGDIHPDAREASTRLQALAL